MFDNRLLYKWTMHGKSPSITTDPNTVQNYSKNCKVINLIRIELINSGTFNATILKFSEKFNHKFLPGFIFGNMFPE